MEQKENLKKSKVILVTGASSGIGKQTAKLLIQSGYRVYGAARHEVKMDDLKGLGVKILLMDLTDDESIQQGIAYILAKEGHIDILINDAGYGFYGTIEDVPLKEARREMEVNLFAIARLCQLVLPSMRRQRSGKIVNISSIAGKIATPLGGWYHASKFALEGLSDTLRQEVKPFGIDVIIIEPGIINTPWWEKARHNMESVSKHSDYREYIAGWQKVLDIDNASDPIVIAETIEEAIEAENPKTRYSKGEHSSTILTAKSILSDKMFDKAVGEITKK